jgi:5'-nucleotidase
VLKADSNAKSVYVHRLRYDTATRRLEIDSKLIEVDDSIEEDPAVAAIVRDWRDKAFAAFKKDGIDPEKTVATLPEMMDGRESAVRYGSTNLTRELNAAMMDAFPGADASIFNSGSIRIDDTLGPGPITQYDVLRVLPYRGDLFLTSMKGAMLAKILAAGSEDSRRGQGSWLQAAGVDVAADGAWTVGGRPINPNADYRVVVNDYLLNGNERGLEWIKPETSGITVLPGAPKEFRRAVIERLQKGFSMATPAIDWPACRSSETIRTAPALAAAATISASQKPIFAASSISYAEARSAGAGPSMHHAA